MKIDLFKLTTALFVAGVVVVCCPVPLRAQDAPGTSGQPEALGEPLADPENIDALLDLADNDLSQLSNVQVAAPALQVEVSSVTRSKSTVGKSAAAVFIITPEMIRRSGATSIPEILRMVPGLHVARIDSNKWGISARGFNSLYAQKMLVLVDGRSVYTPTFAGVYWDIQDMVLEDIQRIEVIRGPGATVWGANAVNGVINIVSKSAKDTQGSLVSAGGGTEDRAILAARQGGNLAPGLDYRISGKFFDRDSGYSPTGENDNWHQGRIGFRTDWNLDNCDRDTLTFQGDYYQGVAGQANTRLSPTAPFSTSVFSNTNVHGLNLLGRWTHKIDDDSSYSLQTYYDRNVRNEYILQQQVDIFDVEWLHRFPLSDTHRITWGLRYRRVEDHMGLPNAFQLSFTPLSRQTHLYSAFIQDQIELIEDTLDFTIGSKFEKNSFTGFEIQPTARLLWTIDERRVAWASVSRAVRTPSRTDDDFQLLYANIGAFPPTFLGFTGNRDVASENLMAYELGYRAQPVDEFSWDASLFFHDYDDLLTNVGTTVVPPPPAMLMLATRANGMTGESYGVELSANYELTSRWRLHGAYTFMQLFLHAKPGVSTTVERDEGQAPRNQVYLRSSWDLLEDFEFDLIGRYVDNVPFESVSQYTSLDARLGWRPNDRWEFSVVGQNLINSHRLESNSTQVLTTEVDRGVFAQAVWRR